MRVARIVTMHSGLEPWPRFAQQNTGKKRRRESRDKRATLSKRQRNPRWRPLLPVVSNRVRVGYKDNNHEGGHRAETQEKPCSDVASIGCKKGIPARARDALRKTGIDEAAGTAWFLRILHHFSTAASFSSIKFVNLPLVKLKNLAQRSVRAST